MKTADPYPSFAEFKSPRYAELVAERSPAYHAFRHAWENNPKERVVAPYPLGLDIESTTFCNLKCTMCWRTAAVSDGTFPALAHMSWDLYERIIDECAETVPSIKLNYYGEPLMDPLCVTRVAYAKAMGVVDVVMNTNATLLTERRAQALLRAGIDGVYFSVDGYSPETFNAIRVGASFETVLENIERFMALRDAGGYNCLTRVNFVRMPANEHEWPAYLDFWQDRVDAVGVADVKPLHGSVDALRHTIVPDFVCAMPFQRMVISPTGIVTPCCEDALRLYVLGNATTETIHQLWHGSKLTALRQAHTSGCYHTVEVCQGCLLPHMT